MDGESAKRQVGKLLGRRSVGRQEVGKSSARRDGRKTGARTTEPAFAVPNAHPPYLSALVPVLAPASALAPAPVPAEPTPDIPVRRVVAHRIRAARLNKAPRAVTAGQPAVA